MERLRYLDFELKIHRGEGGHYTAQVLSSPAGEASGAFTMPFSEDRLELLVLRIGGQLRSSTRRIHTPEVEATRELGGKLFEAIFSGEVLARLRSSLDEVYRQDGAGLRLKLRLQEAPELADLPWEFLFDPSLNRFLAQSNQTPIVRYIEMPQGIRPLTTALPLQVLVMVSSPTDFIRLDVEREKATLGEALSPLIKEGTVRVEWLENATLTALQRSLRSGTYHVFHFIGHGGVDKKTDEGVLVLEDAQERGWHAGAQRIGAILHDHRSLRLAVLNSCEGARNSRTDPFAGVATSLIQQGIPAVVAMQFEITDQAAITFAGEFYTALAEGYPIDAAVAEARKAIYAQPNDVEWGTPVLYMRSTDGVLFDLEQKPAAEQPQPPTPQRSESSSGAKAALQAQESPPIAATPSKLQGETPLSAAEQITNSSANISWPGQWPLSQVKASVWFDGTLVWKGAFKKGFNIRIPTTPGRHELRIKVSLLAQRRYQINFHKPGTYNIELTYDVFPGNFADVCKVYEVEQTGISSL